MYCVVVGCVCVSTCVHENDTNNIEYGLKMCEWIIERKNCVCESASDPFSVVFGCPDRV